MGAAATLSIMIDVTKGLEVYERIISIGWGQQEYIDTS
jgi:hypothetical protein